VRAGRVRHFAAADDARLTFIILTIRESVVVVVDSIDAAGVRVLDPAEGPAVEVVAVDEAVAVVVDAIRASRLGVLGRRDAGAAGVGLHGAAVGAHGAAVDAGAGVGRGSLSLAAEDGE